MALPSRAFDSRLRLCREGRLEAFGTGRVPSAGDAASVTPGTRTSWDLQFVQHCGHASHCDPRTGESSWPIPAGVTYAVLAQLGTEAGILHEAPEVGDVFMQYGPSRKAFVHVGIVMGVLASGKYSAKKPYHDLYTVEGDIGICGQLYGGQILRVRRRLRPQSGDRFLRWVALDVGEQPAYEEQRVA